MLVLVLLVLVVDNLVTRMDMDSLLKTTESSEKAMIDFKATEHKLRVSWDATGNVDRTAALQAITAMCGTGAANVQTARALVEDVRIMPWRVGIVDARHRYLAHNQAWLDYLRGCASDGMRIVDKAADANIEATFRVAGQAYLAALPPFASEGQRARVAALFAAPAIQSSTT